MKNDYLRFAIVDEDGFVSSAPARDAAVVWAGSNATDATVTVMSLHLNWTRIDVAAKNFTDFPQSNGLVYSTGD